MPNLSDIPPDLRHAHRVNDFLQWLRMLDLDRSAKRALIRAWTNWTGFKISPPDLRRIDESSNAW